MFFRLLPWEYAIRNLFRRPLRTLLTFGGLTTVIVLVLVVVGFIRGLEKTLAVSIPAGVDSESRLRISGEGEAGARGGPPGDLYVFIHVEEHPFFEREGSDLLCKIHISFSQAALGAQIEVPTLDGKESLTIPEGTQSGSRFRLRGKGIPRLEGHGKGDLHVFVRVVTPARLNKEQRRLLEELAALERPENEPSEKTLTEKVKDLFS